MAHHHHHIHFDDDENFPHAIEMRELNRAFIIGIVLNIVFVIIEAIAGFATNSLALLTDAGHNLSDVAALALSLIAFRLVKVKANQKYTYGYSKTTILVALANAVILLLAVGSIGVEAVQRLFHPPQAEGKSMAIVAGIGIIVNTVSAFLFFKDKDKDLNVKGAYLHLAADALVSLGVVVAGVLIIYTGWHWLDPLVSIVIMLVILYGTWRLLADSLSLSLDAVPKNVDMEKVKAAVMEIPGTESIHHIHVWALSTTVNAMTAHVVVKESLSSHEEQDVKENIKRRLLQCNIQHATLETERGKQDCKNEDC